MKFKKNVKILSWVFLMVFVFSCKDDSNEPTPKSMLFAVANRGNNTITYHNVNDLSLMGTTNLPDGTQPTYVAYSSEKDKIYTGGLENGMLYEINPGTFEVERTLEVGLGAFHLWLNDSTNQLWVNNINGNVKTTTVVDLNAFTVKKTINLPMDLNLSDAAVQHDVIINPEGTFAYVTILDGSDKSYLIQYNTTDFSIENTLEIGGDGHVGYRDNNLYSLSQNNGEVKKHNPSNLAILNNTLFSGAHGVTSTNNKLFVADLPGGKIGVLDNQDTVISTFETEFDATHNLAINTDGNKLIVTYSGMTQNKIQLFDISNNNLSLNSTLDSGINPFGVAYIER
ncbi:hypothetical protein SAMN04489761_1985 [Tenacibaculum sp. MAR_2009_124]|uniref:YncE family protein n=1 Tax=Tenacibaculum sp. MAR_2009_124 TaxID=1250059 RepID=UPI00089D05D5|nr:hypothetical protein [Tenacibaculum sp. MAR_2009_124]SEB86205.1 hypothetical protein SAMN04489761_1985 [Tenacibaculum sp. MAR_2009_124]